MEYAHQINIPCNILAEKTIGGFHVQFLESTVRYSLVVRDTTPDGNVLSWKVYRLQDGPGVPSMEYRTTLKEIEAIYGNSSAVLQ